MTLGSRASVAAVTRSALLLIACSASAGCATTYTPRPGPRLSVVLDGGQPAYARDGRRFSAGVLGGGLAEAVRGVPEAERHADAFVTRTRTGFATTLIGAATAVAGIGVFAGGFDERRDGQQSLGIALALGGLVVETIGLAIAASAAPRQLDAINAYNDAVELRWAPAAPAGAAPPLPTLVPAPLPLPPAAPP